jgi:peptidoglycan/xylan/chitin deacetylase (PgdA/CDA1 family)
VRGAGRIKNMFRNLQRQVAPAAVILMYHRIVDLAVDPYGIVVSPDNFIQHLKYVRQTCHPMHLLDLTRATQRRQSLPKRALVITFDDGYVDVFSQAYPMLASTQIPATVFVTSGYVDRDCGFWSDQLTRVLLLQDRLPSCLRLQVEGVEHEWPTTTPEERQLAHEAAYYLMKPLPADAQSEKIACLANWAGIERSDCADDRAMKSFELNELTREGLVDIGAHTVNHPTLSALSVDAQYAEIAGSRQRLEAIIGRPVLAFAYPYGMVQDFSDETVKIVETAGFEAACTVTPGVVSSACNPFRLPRYWVGNWDAETFRRNLDWFFLQ